MSNFSENRFPLDIGFGSSGGPERQTDIVTLGSGREERNQRWRRSRRRFEAGYGVKTLDELNAVVAFFEAQRGPLFGFRFRDPVDWKSCPPQSTPRVTDQAIGTGDGTSRTFEIMKSYGDGGDAYQRRIHKTVANSVLVAVDGVPAINTVIDHALGTVTFASAPATGALITAGYEFDVPVRFDTERIEVNLASFEAGDMPSIPLLEILL